MGDREIAVRVDDGLIAIALEKGLDTETLEKLIALRNAELARQAKVAFDEEFAKMQRDFVPVGRSRQATNDQGRKLYSFCPLEDILLANAPIIAAHGFSYKWSEEALPSKEKRIYCIVSGYGHEERAYVDIPVIEGNKVTNAIQQRGSATSYGKRYSFLNAFGIIIAGEEDDAGANVRQNYNRQEPEARPVTADPVDEKAEAESALRLDIKATVSGLVTILGTELDGEAYFSDEEKIEAKKRISTASQGTDLALKLELISTVAQEYEAELKTRQGKTPLAEAVRDALAAKNSTQEELY
jgi:hypothetical protein